MSKESNLQINLGQISNIDKDEALSLNTPVSYDKAGNIVSRFNDNIWDFTPYMDYRKNDSKYLYKVRFQFKKMSVNLLNELKMIVLASFLSEYKSSGRGKVARDTHSTLNSIFIKLHELSFSSVTVLNSSIGLYKYLESIKGKYAKSTLESNLGKLNSVSKLDIKNLKLNLPIKKSPFDIKFESLNAITEKYSNKLNKEQTLYIPLPIHTKILEHSIALIENENSKLTKLLSILELRHVHTTQSNKLDVNKIIDISNTDNQKAISPDKEFEFPTLSEMLKENGLDDLVSKKKNTRVYHSYLQRVFAACYVVISSFTGMRYDEFKALKDDCFQTYNDGSTEYFFVTSYESKISGGNYVDYITIPLVEKAINTIKLIHSSAKKLIPALKDNNFLLVSAHSGVLPTFKEHNIVQKALKEFARYYDLRIGKSDLIQSRSINRSDNVILEGELWNLNTHQFRRTLVVNFLIHGMADLPALKQQLKHMFLSMTAYYGRNSEFAIAKNMARDNILMQEIFEEQIIVKMNIFKELHYSDTQIEGKKGREIQQQRGFAKHLTDEEIKLLIMAGSWDITRTHYGYCTKALKCDKTDVIDPTLCGANCDTSIITVENAKNWHKLYKRNMKLINSDILHEFTASRDKLEMQNTVALKILSWFEIEV